VADITIYKDPALTVEIIDGVPPADQSAALTAALARVTELEGVLVSIKTRAADRISVDAASVDGQADMDAITGVGL